MKNSKTIFYLFLITSSFFSLLSAAFIEDFRKNLRDIIEILFIIQLGGKEGDLILEQEGEKIVHSLKSREQLLAVADHYSSLIDKMQQQNPLYKDAVDEFFNPRFSQLTSGTLPLKDIAILFINAERFISDMHNCRPDFIKPVVSPDTVSDNIFDTQVYEEDMCGYCEVTELDSLPEEIWSDEQF